MACMKGHAGRTSHKRYQQSCDSGRSISASQLTIADTKCIFNRGLPAYDTQIAYYGPQGSLVFLENSLLLLVYRSGNFGHRQQPATRSILFSSSSEKRTQFGVHGGNTTVSRQPSVACDASVLQCRELRSRLPRGR